MSSFQARIIRSILPIVIAIATTSFAQANDDPIDAIDSDGTVHVIDRNPIHPLGIFIESDYVAPHARADASARALSADEAKHGTDALNEALIYLRRSPRAATLLERIDRAGIRISLVINHNCTGGQHMVESMNSLINWDPTCAYHIGKGSDSPALVLMHELVHTLHLAENPQAYLDNNVLKNDVFDTNEEHVTIRYGEIPVARELGEAIRTDHHENRPFHVNDPTVR